MWRLSFWRFLVIWSLNLLDSCSWIQTLVHTYIHTHAYICIYKAFYKSMSGLLYLFLDDIDRRYWQVTLLSSTGSMSWGCPTMQIGLKGRLEKPIQAFRPYFFCNQQSLRDHLNPLELTVFWLPGSHTASFIKTISLLV